MLDQNSNIFFNENPVRFRTQSATHRSTNHIKEQINNLPNQQLTTKAETKSEKFFGMPSVYFMINFSINSMKKKEVLKEFTETCTNPLFHCVSVF